MASFFSVDYWKALYFKAMGGQETAADPNAMSGSFSGVATFTGAITRLQTEQPIIFDTHDGRPRTDKRAAALWKKEKLEQEKLRAVIAAAMEQVLGVPISPTPDQFVPIPPTPPTIDRDLRRKIIAVLEDSVPKQSLPNLSTIKATIKSLHEDVLRLDAERREALQREIDDEDDVILLLAA